ncbi:MAG: hypothetical protein KKF80_00225 [Candidatus Omnitrophica bacterium]|nr:hypothetical protein [Candidatus Omnitrophota bacterium]
MTRDEVIQEIRKEKGYLYKSRLVNYKGKVKGEEEKYTEVIAGYLLTHLDFLDNIKELQRTRGYRVMHNIKKRAKKSNRYEELFASKISGEKLECLGKVIDFQVPLKPANKGHDGVGKIDILSKCDSKAYIIELKYGSNQETLLRAVLEIAYYYQWLWKEKLLKDFGNELNGLRQGDIKKAVLLSAGTRSLAESDDLDSRPNLKKLIAAIKVEVFSIDDNENKVNIVV